MDYKREFPFEQIPALWERIWAQFSTKHFQLFVGLGAVLAYREQILGFTDELDLEMYLKEMTM